MSDYLMFGFLFVALAMGFALGRMQTKKKPAGAGTAWPQQNYFQGLNYLLNDQPDAAIDTFIQALEVNSETLETHLALGSLLRKRGETSRAIRVHQNLLARPSLSRQQLHLAQLELGVDFLKSGLLDRAESLFKELAEVKGLDKKTREKALAHLVEVYQDTKEWLSAIDVADKLTSKKFSATPDYWRELQAHYSCQLADLALEKNDLLEARRLSRNAQRYDKHCARAALLQAKIELRDNSPTTALAILRKLPHQSPRHTSEALPLIAQCFEALTNPADEVALFKEIYQAQATLLTLNYLAEAMEGEKDYSAVVELLLNELQSFPQMEPAAELLKMVADESATTQIPYQRIKGVLHKLIQAHAEYTCSNCGFTAQQNFWLCPGCKSWGTIALQ